MPGLDEVALEVVDPGVVRALEPDGRAARLLDDRRPAVAADVEEGPQLAVAAARDEERLVIDLGGEVGPGGRRVLLAPTTIQSRRNHSLALEVVDRRVVVGPAGRQRGAAR